MPDLIIDPTDDSRAIDGAGRLLDAVRILPAGSPIPPTLAELQAAPVLGYCAPEDVRYVPEVEIDWDSKGLPGWTFEPDQPGGGLADLEESDPDE